MPQASGDGAFVRATAELNGWSLERREGGKYNSYSFLDIKRDGKLAATIERGSNSGYEHRSYSFSPDGETIVSGGANGWLFAYDRAGQQTGFTPATRAMCRPWHPRRTAATCFPARTIRPCASGT